MKKYIKPELFFESFELSQQIAACDFDSNGTLNDQTCRFTGYNKDIGIEMVILMSASVCDVVYEEYCYHNSTASYFGIFNS